MSRDRKGNSRYLARLKSISRLSRGYELLERIRAPSIMLFTPVRETCRRPRVELLLSQLTRPDKILLVFYLHPSPPPRDRLNIRTITKTDYRSTHSSRPILSKRVTIESASIHLPRHCCAECSTYTTGPLIELVSGGIMEERDPP